MSLVPVILLVVPTHTPNSFNLYNVDCGPWPSPLRRLRPCNETRRNLQETESQSGRFTLSSGRAPGFR